MLLQNPLEAGGPLCFAPFSESVLDTVMPPPFAYKPVELTVVRELARPVL